MHINILYIIYEYLQYIIFLFHATCARILEYLRFLILFFLIEYYVTWTSFFFILYTRKIRESLKQLLLYIYTYMAIISCMHTPRRATESFILITRPRNSYPRAIFKLLECELAHAHRDINLI